MLTKCLNYLISLDIDKAYIILLAFTRLTLTPYWTLVACIIFLDSVS